MKVFAAVRIFISTFILLAYFQTSNAATKYIEPKKEFLSSILLVRPGVNDLGGATVEILIKLVGLTVIGHGKNPQLKGWIQTREGYTMDVIGNESYKLKFSWNGGDSSLLQPVNMGSAGTMPALMYIHRLMSSIPKKK